MQENTPLGLVVASFLVVRADVDGKETLRPYTPITKGSALGHFDLLVKRRVKRQLIEY